MARGSHVVEPVADHHRRPELVRGRQRRLQDRHLAQLRIVRRWIIALGSVDAPEEGVQALETEQFAGDAGRFLRGDSQRHAGRQQPLQQSGDAGVHAAGCHPVRSIARAVQCDHFAEPALRHARAAQRVAERRPHQRPQHLLRRNRQPGSLQGAGDSTGDSARGVNKGSVKVEQDQRRQLSHPGIFPQIRGSAGIHSCGGICHPVAAHGRTSASARNRPVWLPSTPATCSGVPLAII